eukprot:3749561-Pyramimonas_sp.AAC.1
MPMTSIRLASEFCPHRVVIGTLPTPRRFARTPTRYFRSRFSTRYFCPLSSAFFVLASSVFASCRDTMTVVKEYLTRMSFGCSLQVRFSSVNDPVQKK